jgi:DNA-binding response OmpR family regulator
MYELTLLYAEDDPHIRENYAFVLGHYFERVYTAEDGKKALELYHEKHPDVLLLDVSMPLMDGLNVAKSIRKEDSKTAIIMLSAHSDKEKLFRAIPLMLSEYLVKPVSDKDLINTILSVCKKIIDDSQIMLKGSFVWASKTQSLYHSGVLVELSKKERQLMSLLTKYFGEYVPTENLITEIWEDTMQSDSLEIRLRQLVSRLNKKLSYITDCKEPSIESGYALGYRIMPQ